MQKPISWIGIWSSSWPDFLQPRLVVSDHILFSVKLTKLRVKWLLCFSNTFVFLQYLCVWLFCQSTIPYTECPRPIGHMYVRRDWNLVCMDGHAVLFELLHFLSKYDIFCQSISCLGFQPSESCLPFHSSTRRLQLTASLGVGVT